jgi:hypothetical protein
MCKGVKEYFKTNEESFKKWNKNEELIKKLEKGIEYANEIIKIRDGNGKYKVSEEKFVSILIYFFERYEDYIENKSNQDEAILKITTLLVLGLNLNLSEKEYNLHANALVNEYNTYKIFLQKCKNENIVLEKLKKNLDINSSDLYDKNTYIKELEKINKVFLPNYKYNKDDLLNLSLNEFLSEFNYFSYNQKICYYIISRFKITKDSKISFKNCEFLTDIPIYFMEKNLFETEKSQILRALINRKLSLLK